MTKTPPKMTDRAALLRNRQRADLDRGMFLQNLIADDIQDRLSMVNRDFTDVTVVTGFPDVWRGRLPNANLIEDTDTLTLTAKSHDLIIHALALHWANDPVGQLIQCRHALKDDGLLLTASLGGQTLQELRACLAQAESEITGGLSPRILPMGEIRDLGALLQRAGFALPVADSLPLDVSYETSFHLMRDLRAMGETNALAARQKTLSHRAIFARTEELYRQAFAQDDRLKATFEVIFMTGWAPGESQPKPLRPGSASARLADALKTSETKLTP